MGLGAPTYPFLKRRLGAIWGDWWEIEVSAEVSRDWGQSRMKPQIRRHMGLQKT